MGRKSLAVVVFLSLVSIAGFAESADDSSVPQGKEASSSPGTTSPFEGTWIGAFTLGLSGNVQQDITITVGDLNEKGYRKVTYAWGWYKVGGASNPPGSLTSWGKEKGGNFYFVWKNKEGAKRTIRMEKIKDDVAIVRLDQEGQIAVNGRPYYEAEFKRK